MADTDRTTITLPQFYIDSVEDCIGILGMSRTQVITKIVELFFDKPENIELVETLKKKRSLIQSKKSSLAIIEEKINKYLMISDNIPLNEFIDFLNIDMEIAREYLHSWAEKFNFRLDNQRILKNK